MVYYPNMIGGWVENEWFCANGKRKEGADWMQMPEPPEEVE